MKEIFQSIPKFTGAETDDFMLWQQKVAMYLSTKDLDSYIASEPDSMATSDQLRSDKKAKSIICMCISDSIVSSVIKESTAKRAWQLLESLYLKKSRTNQINCRILELHQGRRPNGNVYRNHSGPAVETACHWQGNDR